MNRRITAFLVLMAIALFAPTDGMNAVGSPGAVLPDGTRTCVLQPVVTERYDYYTIHGCCEKALVCELKHKCLEGKDGNKYDSIAAWKLRWNYGHRHSSGMCAADSFLVNVDITFHLPKWVPRDTAPRTLVEKWEHYLANLTLHEQGHRDKVIATAYELTRAVDRLSPAPSCETIDREVRALTQNEVAKLIDEEHAYDVATRHGSVQGAVFP